MSSDARPLPPEETVICACGRKITRPIGATTSCPCGCEIAATDTGGQAVISYEPRVPPILWPDRSEGDHGA